LIMSDLHTVTENGADAYTAVGAGDPRVVLFQGLVRSTANGKAKKFYAPGTKWSGLAENLLTTLQSAVQKGKDEADPQVMMDLIVLAFQTRDVRGGKGEYALFYSLLTELFKHYADAVLATAKFIPEYGSWKDVNALLEMLLKDHIVQKEAEAAAEAKAEADAAEVQAPAAKRRKFTFRAPETTIHPLASVLLDLYVAQLQKDAALLESESTSERPSYAGKWAPREGTRNSWLASVLAKRLFPSDPAAKAKYRHLIAGLNKRLNTVEVLMASGRWRDLNPSKVPGRALKRYEHAFLNEILRGNAYAVRHPDDEDRQICAKRFEGAILGESSLHADTLFLHELVRPYRERKARSVVLEAKDNKLWQTKIEATKASASKALKRTLCLADVSGSMTSGTNKNAVPIDVSVALGLFIAQCCEGIFHNKIVTFHEQPTLYDMGQFENASLREKVAHILAAPWGGSTNFQGALNCVLEYGRSRNAPAEEMPERLVVVSDMQFDVADSNFAGSFTDTMTHIRARYAEAGYEVPEIIFWNVNSAHQNVVAKSDEEGAVLLAGFSEKLMKFIFEGDIVPEEDVAMLKQETIVEDGVEKVVAAAKPKRTPYDVFRQAMDDARYAPLRDVVGAYVMSVAR
jgi:hypothetical protein